MASVRARLGASLGLVAALATFTVAPASAGSQTVATPTTAPTARTTTSAPVSTLSTAALPTVGATGRVVVSRSVLANPALRGKLVILVAKRYKGIRYVAGGTSPRTGFDCSGYTRYVFSQLGIRIPRVSRDQYASMRHISISQAVPGDLLFFHSSSGRVYHVAIYAGHGYVWHSPHTGTVVKLEKIWTGAYYVGRLKV
jgi:cell wall-associated NlpC family hydrolase